MMSRGEQDGWCILRTAGPRTIKLTDSLLNAGFDVWTPRLNTRRRLHRAKKAKVEVVAPILPTFVFARAGELPDLVRILDLPISPHPPFSIFRYAGRVPTIREGQMTYLRQSEEQAADAWRREKRREQIQAERDERTQRVAELRAAAPSFSPADKVRVPEGPFAGMTGIVEVGKGKAPVVNFGGGFRVSI
jgi:hypothetical protein